MQTSQERSKNGRLLLLLWISFAASVVCNTAVSFADVPILVHVGLGLLTIAFGVALLTQYRRR
ncbi:hypothetical protein AB0L13_21345 [Saccharopolyspora shandongensis]|uniref:hypothetical protein n=1 Tax=Saccharopolyspora shandongensis TaxID=418495 RepID=UPI0034375221